ncbi:MAG: hypothetical protein HZC41_15560 [Chloroflexi bacterium]|nr:hypothetical protein [Chloroflexota bacterium]
MTLLAVGAVAFQIWRKRVGARHAVPLLLPVVAIGVQPLVNLLVTGSAVASGNAAKSVFGIVPFAWGEVIRRIVENFTRMWSEFFTGVSPREGMYLLPGMALIAVVGLVGIVVGRGSKYGAGDGALAVARGSKPLAEPEEKPTKGAGGNSISRLVALLRNGHVLVALVIVGWLVGGTLAVSTLDTAFWHFKRYQMPFMALFFPLMGWTIGFLFQPARTRWLNNRLLIYVTLVAVFFYLVLETLLTALTFSYAYALNVSYVYQQPLQMARWLQANTPEDAVVAVHDTGLLRYEGGRTTIDMVGLTTPGAADYWRNGPGAVAEFLMDKQPDYIAAYGPGHGFGLSMVADTSIYGEPLAEFPVMLDDRYNVALAAAYQGIYKPEWEKIILWRAGLQTSIWNYGTTNLTPVAYLDVADVQTERSANYQWSNSQHEAGFPTEVHEFDYIDCSHPDPANSCRLIDGGRRINGEEAFELQLELQTLKPDFTPTDALMLVTRLQAVSPGSFDVFVNDEYVATRWIPNIPGYWVEVPTRIPHDKQTRLLQVKIVPHLSSGFYAPYYHAVYYAQDTSNITPPETEIATYQSGAIVLALADIHYQPGAEQVGVNFEWYTDGSATGDYVAFVHLYDDVNQPPVAQTDIRPGGGTLPPGNWLPGVLRDTIMVDLKNVPQGKYKVAIGFYDPATFERLAPDSGGDAEGRLFIGEVEI